MRYIALVLVIAGLLLLGTQAQWNISQSSTPIQVGVPNHMDTYVYWGSSIVCCFNGSTAAQVRAESTYVQADFSGSGDATLACDQTNPHPCQSLDWTDQRIIYSQCRHPYNTAFNVDTAGDPEAWYMHTTSPIAFGNRLVVAATCGSSNNDYTNPASTGASSALALLTTGMNNTSNVGNINTVDIIGNDDTGCARPTTGIFEYPTDSGFCTAMEGWLAAEAFGTGPNSTQAKIIFNGCTANPFLFSGQELIKGTTTPNVLGCRSEEFSNVTNDANGGRFQQYMDTASVITPKSGVFIIGPECCVGATESAKISYGTAFQWLLYANPTNTQNAGTVALQIDIENGSPGGFVDVYPAQFIYPDPNTALTSMAAASGNCLNESGNYCTSHGHVDLCAAGQNGVTSSCNAPTGVFLREFSHCYNHGVLFGVCAALVDAGTSSATIQQSWFHQTYTHTITFAAGGTGSFTVDGGGTMNLSGAAFTCSAGTCGTLSAQSAILLTP